MRLELPNARIMRGEAATLSPSSSKILLCLIACQDQNTHIVTRSKKALAKIAGLEPRTVYNALNELEEANWITRNRQVIQIVNDRSLNKREDDPSFSQTATPTDPTCTIPDPTCIQTETASAHRSDQRTIDHRTNKLSGICMDICDRYGLFNSDYKKLWSIIQGKDPERLKQIFQAMQKTEVKDPIAYIYTALGNGTGSPAQQMFQNFINSLPNRP